MRFLTLCTILVMILGACSGPDWDTSDLGRSTPRSPSPTTILEVTTGPSAEDRALLDSSRRSSTAPNSFKRRAALPSCGEATGTGLQPPKTLRAFACLRSAVTGNGGELTVLRRTNEGDPVITYYRTGPGIHDVEVFTDWTRDRFGPAGWDRETWSFEKLRKLALQPGGSGL